MSASTLIHYFSSYPAAFGFQSSTPLDNITLTSANRKADQSLSDLQTGDGTAAHATLDTEQLISHLRVALVILFPHYPILREMLYLCLKCVNYFSRFTTFSTMLFPNKLGIQLIFYHMFLILFPGNVMRSMLHSSLFFSLSDVIPPTEACLYYCNNWSLAQVQQ